jgi:hypothetical protein
MVGGSLHPSLQVQVSFFLVGCRYAIQTLERMNDKTHKLAGFILGEASKQRTNNHSPITWQNKQDEKALTKTFEENTKDERLENSKKKFQK